jgi:murein DD-endopeptidase MepM/ murein hydrolase activator NlpD
MLPVLAVCFAIGLAAGWLLHEKGPPLPAIRPAFADEPLSATSGLAASPAPVDQPLAREPAMSGPTPTEILHARDLRVPIDGAEVENMRGSFDEHRTGAGGHEHEAVDILAPRNSPIHAAEDGSIAKLFLSKSGGNTIYQFDPTGEYCFYYAHLDHYAEGLHDGEKVKRGEVIGYVGTSGNAPKDTPHLHFAIYQLGPERRWWRGRAIDPYDVYKK